MLVDFKENILSSFIAYENQGNEDTKSSLHQIRREALDNFDKQGFPSNQEEAWKYLNLKRYLGQDYRIMHQIDNKMSMPTISQFLLNHEDSYKIIFVNGRYASWLSETTHQGYDVCTLDGTIRKKEAKFDQHFGKLAKQQEGLLSLNLAFARQGAYIQVPDNVEVEKPIEVLFISTQDHDAFYQPRNLIIVGKNAKVQIIERHQNIGDGATFTNAVSEIFVAENAQLDYTKYQNDKDSSCLIDNTFLEAKRDSRPSISTFSFGGKMIRNNVNIFIEDSGVDAQLRGLSLLTGKEMVDNHTNIEHRAPHSESYEMYKGIYDGSSQGVFNGRVLVAEGAMKTNGFQQNNNMILSEKAKVNAKPQLEIFNDDVKCSHGCTMGQLDEKAMFYLKSRGIPTEEAKALLLYAFSDELLQGIQIPEIHNKVKRLISKKLNVNLDFNL